MNPLAFAQKDCGNLVRMPKWVNGQSKYQWYCLSGLCEMLLANQIEGKGTIYCLVQDDLRCTYVEQCVLPSADYRSPKDKPNLQKLRGEAGAMYLALHGQADGQKAELRYTADGPRRWTSIHDLYAHFDSVDDNLVEEQIPAEDQLCADCGEPRQRGHRYCNPCAGKHRSKPARDRKRKQRQETRRHVTLLRV